MKKVLLYIWQLPQNLLGLLLSKCYKVTSIEYFRDVKYFYCSNLKGGISLGKYILLNHECLYEDIMHEYGHTLQSKKWGWLYLPVVGLASVYRVCFIDRSNYFNGWPENEADSNSGIER